MVRIELDDSQMEMLVGLIERQIDDLRAEIHDTDTMEFRNKLREERERWVRMLETIQKVAA